LQDFKQTLRLSPKNFKIRIFIYIILKKFGKSHWSWATGPLLKSMTVLKIKADALR
jgi:hypothetical protein